MKYEKFKIINETLSRNGNLMKVGVLCDIAGVSRSGFYNWLNSKQKRNEKESKDRKDFELILRAYNQKGYHKGAKAIYMHMLHWVPSVVMNIKKIRRLMKKYNLICPIRRLNPYRRMANALKTSSIAENIVNREFEKHGPRKVLLTDITYIPYNKRFCYLSTIIDAYTKQVLSYSISDSLEIDFVLDTVKEMVHKHKLELTSETLIHSDQGCHYTSVQFRNLLKDKGLRQSMSRKANCWDNAPQESFFGHMKDELNLTNCNNYEEVKKSIKNWIHYYNNERYQWKLAKLSPNEFYKYITTGDYPIKNE